MKYKTENDFCREITQMIYMDLMTTGRKYEIQVLSEVPRGSHNNHADILLINRTTKKLLILEYKLNNWKLLAKQLQKNTIYSVGIINQKMPELNHDDNIKYGYPGVISYVKDSDYDRIHKTIVSNQLRWMDYTWRDLGWIYWYGYRNASNDFEGGTKYSDRLSFYQLYIRAVRELLRQYPCLDFTAVCRILGFYSESVARKYYNIATADNKTQTERQNGMDRTIELKVNVISGGFPLELYIDGMLINKFIHPDTWKETFNQSYKSFWLHIQEKHDLTDKERKLVKKQFENQNIKKGKDNVPN